MPRFVTLTTGVTCHYRLDFHDSGRLPLVLVNALGTDLRLWDAVVDQIAGHMPVLRYDARGHGLSGCPPGPYTVTQLGDDLAGLLDALGFARAVIAGISLGGLTALDFGQRFPHRTASLVLLDTLPRIATAAFWQERIDWIKRDGLETAASSIVTRWFAPQFAHLRPDEYAGYTHMLARMPAVGYVGACAALRDADLWFGVSVLEMPALIVCGEHDMATTPAAMAGLAQALPNGRSEIIEGVGHLPCVERPAATSSALLRFMREQVYER